MELIQSQQLSNIPEIEHGFFCRGDAGDTHDNFSYKNGSREEVINARKRACEMIHIKAEQLTHVYQVHGTDIYSITKQQRGAGALDGTHQVGEGDGMITCESHVPLAILVADCIPVYFTAPGAPFVGIAHAGWRGTLDAISIHMVERIQAEYAVPPSQLRIWVGPGISPIGFTVGLDVWDLFYARWKPFSDCFHSAQRAIDLKKMNQYQLESIGVLADNIDVSTACTFSDRRFFSYRREGAGSGHNLAVIMRRE